LGAQFARKEKKKAKENCTVCQKEKKGKTMQAAKSSSHQLRKRGHLGRRAPSPEKRKAQFANLGQLKRVGLANLVHIT